LFVYRDCTYYPHLHTGNAPIPKPFPDMPQTTKDITEFTVGSSIVPPQDDFPQDQRPSDDGHGDVPLPAQVNEGVVSVGPDNFEMHMWYLEGDDDLDEDGAHHKNAFLQIEKQK
jgi:hypothetical protein